MKPALLAFALATLPLLAACAAGGAPPPSPAPGAGTGGMEGLEAELRAAIRAAAGDTATVAVALRDLATGDSLLIDARERMHAASTMKVPVMLELFRRADAGEIRLDQEVPVTNAFRSIVDGSPYALDPREDGDTTLYARAGGRATLRELIERMIVRSSNLATNLLIARAEPARVNATLAALGAEEMRVLRGVEDGPAFRAGLNNTTTAYGLMRTMEAVASGRAASPRSTREMLSILERQEFREMVPAGLPPGTRVASKTGSITRISHDAAVVFPEGRPPYVLVVLTRGFADEERAFAIGAEISRRVHARLAGR